MKVAVDNYLDVENAASFELAAFSTFDAVITAAKALPKDVVSISAIKLPFTTLCGHLTHDFERPV